MEISAQGDIARLEASPADVQRWQQARRQLMDNRAGGALPVYRQLTWRYPGVPHLWYEQGMAAAKELDFALACESLDKAAETAERDSSILLLIAQEFHRLRRPEKARECFERAVKASPESIHARLSLAAWRERERQLDAAWAETEACLRLNARDPRALYYRAFLLERRRLRGEAEAALRELLKGLPPDDLKISSLHLLAVVLDGQGNHAEAMQRLVEAKALLSKTANTAAMTQTYDKADFRRRKVLEQLRPEMIRQWRVEKPLELALLGGHPRSGTTLLEQILGAHRDIRAVDESDAFVNEIGDRLAPLPPTPGLSAEALNKLPAGQQTALRERYIKSLLREDGSAGASPDPAVGARLLLDKNPSPTGWLHLWLRIFPESKVIIALRDPRDVVISCFFQNLAITPVNVNFLSLDRAVKHYEDMMDVWLRLREMGGFNWIESRYEDVVRGLEAEGRRVTQFLGLEWEPSQERYYESARGKLVFSPTYNEVTQSVHNRAVGRWRNYAEALDPLRERLDRYVRAFGYRDEGT